MRILFVSTVYYPYHLGGAEISTKILAEGLADIKENEVAVLTHGEREEIEFVNGVKVIRKNYGIASKTVLARCADLKSSMISKIYGKMADILKNKNLLSMYEKLFFEYDVVIMSGNCANMARRNIWIAAGKSNIISVQILRDPILLFFKDCKPFKYAIIDKLYRKMSLKDNQKIKYTVSPTKALINAHKELGVKFNKELVIPNTVDDSLCKTIPYEQKKDIIIYVGAVSKRKGCHTLIKAFEKLHKEMPEYILELVGNVEDVDIPVNDYIVSSGHMDIQSVYEKIASAKLLVLPSEWEEAFGRVIVEGIYNHTLSIGSDRGGIPEIFGEHSEYIFKSGNEDELHKCMKNILQFNKIEYEKKLDTLLIEFERFRLKNHIKTWNDFLKKSIREEVE